MKISIIIDLNPVALKEQRKVIKTVAHLSEVLGAYHRNIPHEFLVFLNGEQTAAQQEYNDVLKKDMWAMKERRLMRELRWVEIPPSKDFLQHGMKVMSMLSGKIFCTWPAQGSVHSQNLLSAHELIKTGQAHFVFGSRFEEQSEFINFTHQQIHLLKEKMKNMFYQYTHFSPYRDHHNPFRMYQIESLRNVKGMAEKKLDQCVLEIIEQELAYKILPIKWINIPQYD